MATYSTNLGITLPADGEFAGTWGQYTNTNLGTLIEQAISGYTTQGVVAATDTTITIPNGSTGVARNMYIQLTGTGGASTNLIVPANRKLYFIHNATSGTPGQVTVKVAGQTGVSVPAGVKMLLVCNGTDIINAVDYFAALTTTTFSASGAVTLSPANATVTISPTGTGTVTVNPATAGTLNNVSIGATTASTGAFTTLSASSTVSGAGFTTYLASPAAIGGTAPAGGRFTFAHTAPVAVAFSATAMAIDCALSNVFTTTFTANVSVAPTLSNLKDGQTINWFITQDATGSRTMTWPTSFKWPGGTAGVLSTAANSVDLVVATYRSGTGFWYVTIAKAFS
jgi:hypothetical protein